MSKQFCRATGLVLCVLAVGCSRSPEDYVPSADVSRTSLEAALAAWRDGKAQPGEIEGTNPLVQVVDSGWASGEPLRSFEILKEEPRDTGTARRFLVRLTQERMDAPTDVHYVVSGLGPVLVQREKDSDATGSGM
jgi:hypothetical protein